MLREFKKFATRGNVLDMAIGVILGGAFGKIVSSLVDDIIMPPIGLMLGKVDFSNFYINLSGGSSKTLSEAKELGNVTINYGIFVNRVLDFVIIAFTIFIVIKQINKLRDKDENILSTVKTKSCPYCTYTIPLEAKRCPHCTSNLK